MAARKPNPVDIVVGRNIRVYRLAAKMSQEALGDKIGVTFQQVQKYEKGTNRVGASRLNQIANALGASVTKLFEGTGTASGEKRNTPSVTELIAEPHALRLAQAFAGISETPLRLSIVQLVENLSSGGKISR